MTLIYGTGFDLCTTFADAVLDGWSIGTGTGTVDIQTANGRNGNACLRINRSGNSVTAQRTFGTQTGQTYIGFAHFMNTNAAIQAMVSIQDSGSNQFWVYLNADGSLVVQRGGATTLGSTAAGTFTANTYHFFEIGFVIAGGTSGSVTIRRNQTTVLTLTGINTQATGNASWNQIAFGGGGNLNQSSGVDFRYDDFYVCNSLGSVNNNFLGDIGVRAALPNAVGTNGGFAQTGGSGGGHYTAVNEKPNDGDSSYVSSSTIDTIDTYTYPALAGNVANIFGVLAKPVARKDDAGNRHISTRYRASGGSELDFTATDMTLTTTYTQGMQIQELNPVTGLAWTASDISTGEFGPHVSS